MLAGVGAVGAIGAIAGALIGLGMPEYEAKRYEGRVRHGGILLSVHCDDHEWTKKAAEILRHTGAEDIASTGEASADFGTSDKPVLRTRTTSILTDRTSDSPHPPVLEDEEIMERTRTSGSGS
jgi:hypothetical protein